MWNHVIQKLQKKRISLRNEFYSKALKQISITALFSHTIPNETLSSFFYQSQEGSALCECVRVCDPALWKDDVCFLYKFTLCDFRTVFGALVSSSSDPAAEPNTGERCTERRGQGTEREGAKQGSAGWRRAGRMKRRVWAEQNRIEVGR